MSGIEDDPTLPEATDQLFSDSPPPRHLGGRYTLEEELGVGGRAVVWRAFDEALARTVAVKLLRRSDTDDVTRLRREAATAGRVPHPGIVAVYDTGVDEDVAWLALEHVDGPTLLEVLRHHPRGMPTTTAAAVAEQVAVALGHAHEHGLVHRDVKPSNLLLSPDGVVKIADFGVAAAAGDGSVELAGTRRYAPPEQLLGHHGADQPTVDVYALGVVLHECLTGRPAFTGSEPDTRRHLLAPRQLRVDVPRDLDAVVRRATDPDPSARYPDGDTMATALRRLVAVDPNELTAGLVAGVRRQQQPERPTAGGAGSTAGVGSAAADASDTDQPAPGGSLGRVAAAAAVILVAAGGLTVLATSQDDPGPTAPTAVADVGVPVSAVEVFDPYGSISGGGGVAAAAVDGDAGTAWSSPAYPVPLRSLGTPGVGLWLDVGEPRAVQQVELQLRTGAVSVELLAADRPPDAGTTEADWRSLDRVVRPGERATLDATGPPARYWLVWFTELEPVGETWQAVLTDLRFRPGP